MTETGFSRAAFFRRNFRITTLFCAELKFTINLTPLSLIGSEPRIRQIYRQLLWQLVDIGNPLFADILPESRQTHQSVASGR
ncbi:transcriptional regulator, partial [Lacticaseibacillus rhamnosus MTCC 5462]